jgi:hypothetical protein
MRTTKSGRPRAGFGYETSDVPPGRVQSRRPDKPAAAKSAKPGRVVSRKGAASMPRPDKSRR